MLASDGMFAEEAEQVDSIDENENEQDGVHSEAEEQAEKKTVKPKKVLNPRPKLNEDTLRGPRGLTAVTPLFEKVKFRGKGHEEEDLATILKTYEYWCHRMFPKFPFDNCIERIEKLGTKKSVQTYLKKIRMDLIDEDAPMANDAVNQSDSDSDNEQGNPNNVIIPPVSPSNVELNEEMLERIRINRERAENLRRESLRRFQESQNQNAYSSPPAPQNVTMNNADITESNFLASEHNC